MSVTGSIMAGVGLAGSIGGAAIGANAAGNAASTQANAAENAAQLQYQESQNALGFQEQQWNQEQSNLQPWLQSGGGALNQLDYLLGVNPNTSLGIPGGSVSGATPPGAFGPPSQTTGGPTPSGNPSMPVARSMAVPSNGSLLNAPSLNGSGNPVANPVGVSNGGFDGTAPRLMNPGPVSASGTVAPTANPVAAGGGTPLSGMTGLESTGGPTPQPGGSSAGGFGSLLQPYGQTFSAPTEAQMEANDPGYQARWNLQQQALQQSAAARGNLLTGGTEQALGQAAQDYASNEYGNYYNQAYNTFASGYNQYQQQQANEYNRLASLAGIGQTAAGQLGSLGQSASNNVSSNLLNTGANIGQQMNNAGAANASGIVGAANAYGGAIGGATNSIQNLLLLQQLQNMGSGGGGGSSYGSYGAGMGF